jgi:hypothetical protein
MRCRCASCSSSRGSIIARTYFFLASQHPLQGDLFVGADWNCTP